MITGSSYSFQLAVNGHTLYHNNYISLAAGANTVTNSIFRGININTPTAEVTITVRFFRDTSRDQFLWTYLRIFKYTNAYDPHTGCCPTGCPLNTGLAVQIDPPTCIYCDIAAGLIYSPSNGTCVCASGFYLDQAKTFYCHPCQTLYCQVCDPLQPTQCKTCVAGATLNTLTATCTCGTGSYVNGANCLKCSSQCATCSSPTGVCTTCKSTSYTNVSNNCQCVSGYYFADYGQCVRCVSPCVTCASLSVCTACEDGYQLTEGLCVKNPPPSSTSESDTFTSVIKIGILAVLSIVLILLVVLVYQCCKKKEVFMKEK